MWQGVCSFGLPNNKRLAPVRFYKRKQCPGFVLLVLRFVLSSAKQNGNALLYLI
jgi:hypothetical protein